MKIKSKMLFPDSLIVMKDGENVPTEIQIIPFGEHHTVKGDFVLDKEAENEMVAAFDNQKNDMVIDYEHATLTGNEAPAAGWITKLINRGSDGIWAAVKWTKKATEYLKNREYRYLSPVFLKRISDGKAVRLINAALTNQPAIDGMVPVVNKDKDFFIEEENGMKEKLLKILSMKEGDSEQIIAKIETLISNDKTVQTEMKEIKGEIEKKDGVIADLKNENNKNLAFTKEIAKEFGLEKAGMSEIKAAILAAKAGSGSAEGLAAKFAALEARLKKKDAAELVEAAIIKGKLYPAQREWALDYAESDMKGFKVYVKKAVTLVDFGDGTASIEKVSGTIDSTTLLVAKQLGVPEADLKKSIKEK